MMSSHKVWMVAILLVSLVIPAAPLAAQAGADTTTPTETITPSDTTTLTGTAAGTDPATPTETVTPGGTPTGTPTETPTPTATSVCADELEPNDTLGSGEILIIDEIVGGLTLSSAEDVDYFLLWTKPGQFYQVTTGTPEGVDTRLRIFNAEGELLAENDDYVPGNPAARVRFHSVSEGWLYVAVDSLVPIDWGCRRYTIRVIDVPGPTATPTASPVPTTTPAPTATPLPTTTPLPVLHDVYEPNYDFSTATDMGVGQTVALNFFPHPPGSGQIDNDFFRLFVKVGQELRFETTALAAGLDTNLIVYREDETVIAGNDDCQPGQRRSCLDWKPDYTGLVYVLVGPVGLVPHGAAAGARAYKLVVTDLVGLEADDGQQSGGGGGRSQPGPPTPLPTPMPLAATQAPAPTGVAKQVQVRPFSAAQPTPTAVPLQPILVQVTVYHDANDNQAADVDEGVMGLNVVVLDSLTNHPLGQAFTNSHGHAKLFVSARDLVRLSVPYLGYNQTVRPPGSELEIRLPGLHLPSIIP